MSEDQCLVLRDNAKAELMQIKSIEDGIGYLNKISSIEVWVRAEKKDAELQNLIAEQKLRTQRILGSLIKQGQENGEIRRREDNNHVSSHKLVLEDVGITKNQSSNFKAIAEIPDETFEEFIQEKKDAVNNAVAELTTTGAVRLAKSLKDKQKDLQRERDVNMKLDEERELRDLASDLRKKYDKEQIQLLIKFLTK